MSTRERTYVKALLKCPLFRFWFFWFCCFLSLAWVGAQPCGARSAKRLGRSGGPGQRRPRRDRGPLQRSLLHLPADGLSPGVVGRRHPLGPRQTRPGDPLHRGVALLRRPDRRGDFLPAQGPTDRPAAGSADESRPPPGPQIRSQAMAPCAAGRCDGPARPLLKKKAAGADAPAARKRAASPKQGTEAVRERASCWRFSGRPEPRGRWSVFRPRLRRGQFRWRL